MANKIGIVTENEGTITITLASLASNAARKGANVTNSNDHPAAFISVKITTGTSAPANFRTYDVYLYRKPGTHMDDNEGTGDEVAVPFNAILLGSIKVSASASTAFYGIFDTWNLGPLGPTWSIGIKNNTNQSAHATAANHYVKYNYYIPQQQNPA